MDMERAFDRAREQSMISQNAQGDELHLRQWQRTAMAHCHCGPECRRAGGQKLVQRASPAIAILKRTLLTPAPDKHPHFQKANS